MKKNKTKRLIFLSLFFTLLVVGLGYISIKSFNTLTEQVTTEDSTLGVVTCSVTYWEEEVTSISGRTFFFKTSDCGNIITENELLLDSEEYLSVKETLNSSSSVTLVGELKTSVDKNYMNNWIINS